MKRPFLLLLPLCFFLAREIPLIAAGHADELFQSALLAETGERDLDKAISLYKQVLRESTDQPDLLANAKLHLGICYEQLDRAKEAISCYQALLQPSSATPADIREKARSHLKHLQEKLASALAEGSTRMVAAGGSQSAAVESDGSVLWWGLNPVSPATRRPSPAEGFSTAQSISLGVSHILVLNQDGSVLAWGGNSHGQLGDGTTVNRAQPVTIKGLSDMIAVAAGETHSLAVKSGGTVWAWGSNRRGQLGDQTFSTRVQPVTVAGLSGILAVACGLEHSIALKEDGTVWTWGSNESGQLGMGVPFPALPYPKKVPGLASITAIAAGSKHNVALKIDGTVWAWGDNSLGQLGINSTESSDKPVRIPELSDIRAIAAGPTYTLAVKKDGTVWAWGDNKYGALGIGDALNRLSPAFVSTLTNIQAVAAGAWHNLALQTGGAVWSWGRNISGQVGDGTTLDRLVPLEISVPTASHS